MVTFRTEPRCFLRTRILQTLEDYSPVALLRHANRPHADTVSAGDVGTRGSLAGGGGVGIPKKKHLRPRLSIHSAEAQDRHGGRHVTSPLYLPPPVRFCA